MNDGLVIMLALLASIATGIVIGMIRDYLKTNKTDADSHAASVFKDKWRGEEK